MKKITSVRKLEIGQLVIASAAGQAKGRSPRETRLGEGAGPVRRAARLAGCGWAEHSPFPSNQPAKSGERPLGE